jgi:hypothetical protein
MNGYLQDKQNCPMSPFTERNTGYVRLELWNWDKFRFSTFVMYIFYNSQDFHQRTSDSRSFKMNGYI